MKSQSLNLTNAIVFFDFDNTMTSFDALDAIIERFAVDRRWMALEARWKKGEIGSRQCLTGQLKSLRVTKRSLQDYLDSVRVDPWTKKLFHWLKQHQAKPIILSDNFSWIINYVLKKNNIKGIKVYANRLAFKKDQLIPSFPYVSSCSRCGHCKKSQFPVSSKGKTIVYIGDGRSDMCPASEADFVFAKDPLWSYLKKKKRPCRKFLDFKDIYRYLRKQYA